MDEENKEQNPIAELSNTQNINNVPFKEVTFGFKGAWYPTADPLLIGSENFQSLINMRYNDNGIEGVNGYTFRNAVAISTYTNIKNGIHFRTQGRTNESYVIVQSANSGNYGRLYINKTAIGSTGNFSAVCGERSGGSQGSYLFGDSEGALDGRFCFAPGENIAYANGADVILWSGEETSIAAAFTTSDAAESDPEDVTDKLTNTKNDSSNIVDIGTTNDYLTIMTTRPVQGFKIYIETPNGTVGNLSVKYWNGSAYTDVSNLTDNTDTGAALALTGTVEFDSTRTTAKPHHFQERYLYSYQIYLASGDAEIYHITCDMPAQAPTNIWDGVYRTPIQCQYYDASAGTYEDFTLHVSESSTVNTPVGAIMDAMTTSDRLVMMFDEPMSGVKITMLGNLVNTNSANMEIVYWSGTTWSNITEVDGTAGLSKSGSITWTPPSDEVKTTLFGTQGYAYMLKTDAALSDATVGKDTEDVVIDLITGIPAQIPVKEFKFPVQYRNRLMLCNYEKGNEFNRIDFSANSAPDVFNGEDSSLNGYQSIYVGGSEHLTCAKQLYNRYGSNLFTSLIIFKANELYLLTGESPIDFQLYPVSLNVGCPAPKSLVSAEIGIELGENVKRNVLIFISNSGPMMYDGTIISPISGIETYFDPNETNSINYSNIDTSFGWFDGTYNEYNMVIPVGESSAPNLWLVYDLVRKKWYKKDVGEADKIQCGFATIDANGKQYIYGGTAIGKIAQLENGTAWNETAIANEVHTGNLVLEKNLWDIIKLRRAKFFAKRTSAETSNVTMTIYADTDSSLGAATTFDISISGSQRVANLTADLNRIGWTFSVKFTFSSTTLKKGMEPLLWGIQYQVARKNY